MGSSGSGHEQAIEVSSTPHGDPTSLVGISGASGIAPP